METDLKIRLADLAECAPALTESMAALYSEACVACLDLHDHRSGVGIGISYVDRSDEARIEWEHDADDHIRRAHVDREKRVDQGACAIALLVMPTFGDLSAVMPSPKFNGIDYYLSNRDESHLIFNHSAVLEVSGIQTENDSNTVNARIRVKKDRLEKYRSSSTSQVEDLPTYICVVEFSQPKAKVVLA